MANQTLNLDELFGIKDPVIVVYNGTEYRLNRPDSWTPEQYARYLALQNAVQGQDVTGLEINEENARKLIDILDKMLQIISPEMHALSLPTEKQSAIITHYARIVFPQQLEESKKARESKNPTGA